MKVKEIIVHRVNSLELLAKLDKNFGAEIDVRYHENDLVLDHDPFNHHNLPKPQKLEDFLQNYKLSGHLIVNSKSEGVEKAAIELMNKYKIKNWFFLDLSMPYFVRFANYAESGDIKGFGVQNLAVRFSEEETIDYALNFAGRARWVWVDCFTKMPLDDKIYQILKLMLFVLNTLICGLIIYEASFSRC